MRLLRLFVILSVLLIVVGGPPIATAEQGGPTEPQYYLIQGKLQVLDVERKTAVIDGYTWDLIADFCEKNVSGLVDVSGRMDFGTSGVDIVYHVIVHPEPVSTADLVKHPIKPTQVDSGSDEIKEIQEKGGKVLKIVVPAT